MFPGSSLIIPAPKLEKGNTSSSNYLYISLSYSHNIYVKCIFYYNYRIFEKFIVTALNKFHLLIEQTHENLVTYLSFNNVELSSTQLLYF